MHFGKECQPMTGHASSHEGIHIDIHLGVETLAFYWAMSDLGCHLEQNAVKAKIGEASTNQIPFPFLVRAPVSTSSG